MGGGCGFSGFRGKDLKRGRSKIQGGVRPPAEVWGRELVGWGQHPAPQSGVQERQGGELERWHPAPLSGTGGPVVGSWRGSTLLPRLGDLLMSEISVGISNCFSSLGE